MLLEQHSLPGHRQRQNQLQQLQVRIYPTRNRQYSLPLSNLHLQLNNLHHLLSRRLWEHSQASNPSSNLQLHLVLLKEDRLNRHLSSR